MNSYCTTAQYSVERVSRNFKMPSMHYHDAFELYYLEAGSREYFVEDKLFSVNAGEFVLIPPGKLHRTGGEHCVRTLVQFTGEFLEKTFTAQAAARLTECFCHVKIQPGIYQQRCQILLKQLAEAAGETEFALILGNLLQTLAKCGDSEIRYDQASAIVAYINQNYPTIENIDQIAGAFYISKYHLCRVFKKAMQLTVIEYLNHVRLKNAAQLLTDTDKEIAEIAQLCGYHAVSYFSNLFKKSVGFSPSEYRKQSQKQYIANNVSK